jgi:hypothetical protein
MPGFEIPIQSLEQRDIELGLTNIRINVMKSSVDDMYELETFVKEGQRVWIRVRPTERSVFFRCQWQVRCGTVVLRHEWQSAQSLAEIKVSGKTA